jgi:hypothetical protein
MSRLPYVFPALLSPQVKAIREYLKFYSEFDFEGLSKVTTDDFTQQTWPLSLDQPIRTKPEEIAALKQLQEALAGKPIQVSTAQHDRPFAQIANLSLIAYHLRYRRRFGEDLGSCIPFSTVDRLDTDFLMFS